MDYNIFITWSGDRSRRVAHELCDWIPQVIQAAKPFFSPETINKGTQWSREIARALESSKIGIVCLTPENLSASWLTFESGALSRSLKDDARVCTFLFDRMLPGSVPSPLGLFQATAPTEAEVKDLMHSVRDALNADLANDRLDKAFQKHWPELQTELAKIHSAPAQEPQQPARDLEVMVSDILDIVRADSRRRSDWDVESAPLKAVLDQLLPHLQLALNTLPGVSARSRPEEKTIATDLSTGNSISET